MTTDVTVGRFGGSMDVGLASWEADGDQVRANGYVNNATKTQLTLARQQLLGMVDSPDDQVVPVTYALDPSSDGYYRVTGASVPVDVGRWYAGSFPWSVDLTRVRNFRWPDITVRTYGDVRDNIDSFTTGNTIPVLALPSGAVSATVAEVGAYTTAFGDVEVDEDTALNDSRVRYKIAPASYYTGAARIEQKISSTWYPVVGRQVSAAATDVRVNNGLLRIAGFLHATPARSGLSMESWVSGSTWGAAKTVGVSNQATDCITDGPAAYEIIRNRPEEVRLAISFPSSVAKFEICTLTVTLRRGYRIADVKVANSEAVQWELDSSVSLTTGTGGAQESADDASSQRVVFGIRSASTVGGTGNKEIQYTGTSTGITFGWGVRTSAGGAPWGSSIGTMLNRWYAYLGATQRIIG